MADVNEKPCECAGTGVVIKRVGLGEISNFNTYSGLIQPVHPPLCLDRVVAERRYYRIELCECVRGRLP